MLLLYFIHCIVVICSISMSNIRRVSVPSLTRASSYILSSFFLVNNKEEFLHMTHTHTMLKNPVTCFVFKFFCVWIFFSFFCYSIVDDNIILFFSLWWYQWPLILFRWLFSVVCMCVCHFRLIWRSTSSMMTIDDSIVTIKEILEQKIIIISVESLNRTK